ncbi:kinase R-like protein, partial [Trifolium medium]|nr:kinase R-like protein [Trifolium medium]
SYVAYIQDEVSNIEESCRIETKVLISRRDGTVKCNDTSKCEYPEKVHTEYLNGIELRWRPTCSGKQQDGDSQGKRKQELPLICILEVLIGLTGLTVYSRDFSPLPIALRGSTVVPYQGCVN